MKEVATGKRVNRPSDGPSESARLVRIRDEMNEINQHYRNVNQAQLLLGATHDALNSFYNMGIRVMERSAYALNGTLSQVDLNAIATELRQVQQEMVRVAATRIDGRHVFSGSYVDSEPLALNGTQYDYQGDDRALFIEVAHGDQIQINATGTETFSVPGAELINSLGQLIQDLEAGDLTAARQSMDNFQRGIDEVEVVRVRVGTNLGRVDDAKSRLDETMFRLTKEISSLEDADLAESISAMVQAETGLKAALSVGSSLRTINLFDYLG
jgi:flagellar hook-associated protein 3 FlgL